MNVTDGTQLPPDEPNTSADAPVRRQESTEVETGKPGAKRSKFRLRRVLAVVVPVAILALVVVALPGLIDVDALLSDLSRPALAPAKGQVLFQGQPLLNGRVVTRPTGRGVSAMGWTDDEGKFTLKTDVRGNYVNGATVGEHRVTVTAYGSSGGASAPPLLSPKQYASMGTSPLKITIGRSSDKNEFKLVLEGEPPSRPSPPTKNKQGAPKRSDPPGGPTESKPYTPDQP